MEKMSMRRLVIGIMLALFAVGAYSQEDDMYVYQNSKKEKHSEIKTLMKEVRELDKRYPKKDRYQREKEYLNSFFQSLVGEWTTKEGQLINIEKGKIEIEDVVVLEQNGMFGELKENYKHNGIILTLFHYNIPHPFLKDLERGCEIEIIEFDEDHIILTVSEGGGYKTYRLTRAK